VASYSLARWRSARADLESGPCFKPRWGISFGAGKYDPRQRHDAPFPERGPHPGGNEPRFLFGACCRLSFHHWSWRWVLPFFSTRRLSHLLFRDPRGNERYFLLIALIVPLETYFEEDARVSCEARRCLKSLLGLFFHARSAGAGNPASDCRRLVVGEGNPGRRLSASNLVTAGLSVLLGFIYLVRCQHTRLGPAQQSGDVKIRFPYGLALVPGCN